MVLVFVFVFVLVLVLVFVVFVFVVLVVLVVVVVVVVVVAVVVLLVLSIWGDSESAFGRDLVAEVVVTSGEEFAPIILRANLTVPPLDTSQRAEYLYSSFSSRITSSDNSSSCRSLNSVKS